MTETTEKEEDKIYSEHIADYIIRILQDQGDNITRQKLYNVLLLLQLYHIVEKHTFLFRLPEILATDHGPWIVDLGYRSSDKIGLIVREECYNFAQARDILNAEQKDFIDKYLGKMLNHSSVHLFNCIKRTSIWKKSYQNGVSNRIKEEYFLDIQPDEEIYL